VPTETVGPVARRRPVLFSVPVANAFPGQVLCCQNAIRRGMYRTRSEHPARPACGVPRGHVERIVWPQVLLGDLRRIIAPAGKVVIRVPNMVSLTHRIAWLLGRLPSCAASANLPPSPHQTGYESSEPLPVGGHVIDFNLRRISELARLTGFEIVARRGSELIWHRQIVPTWAVPVSLSANILLVLAPGLAAE
jgi:hypothetical protein